ncbi:DUF3299 domain-containing protein [Vibrio hannami]|uniref:DUF3299 domain-containing protein n=1 Tax=Vibrio hannami TaxID=2717094 RepID=UPI00240F9FB7|nr:DUF3299 domain-containing protein [Vibrio hannami]MDG3087020.1 DUF3299 domain-containing protein [Vibrio hannami]
MKKILFLLGLILAFSFPHFASASDGDGASSEVLELDWLDLIPEKERNLFNNLGMPAMDHSGDAASQSQIGSIRPELNGSQVKIPGFVIPLEGTADLVTEFLLVPFLGACIHVPPPPANQIIYVRFKEGAPVTQLWDVVYVVGTLKTETVFSEDYLAEAGYVIEGVRLEDYDDM